MPAAIALTPSTAVGPYEPVSAAISGLTAATSYTLTVIRPSGQVTTRLFLSDGAGAKTMTIVPNAPGTLTFEVRPTTEHTGGTTATASASIVSVGG